MKKLLIVISIITFAVVCDMFDNRTEVARAAVEKQYNNPEKMPAHMIGFKKTNGESFESRIVYEPGMHKIYKLYYTAEFESEISGFIVEDDKGSAFPRIFNQKEEEKFFDAQGRFLYYNFGYNQKKDIKAHEKFYIKSYVLLRKRENGWEQIDE